MGTGKQDSRIREELDKLHQVPGPFQFRSALVWQQIETRLTERKRKHGGWLYAAAAVVLLCVVGWWLVQHKKAPDPVVRPPLVSTKTNTTPDKDTVQKLTNREVQAQASDQQTVRRPGKQEIIIQQAPAQSPVVEVDTSSRLLVAVPPADSLSRPITVAKPRFRIAHINELDNNNNSTELAQQPLRKKPLMSTFLFSPKNVTEDIIIKENTGYLETKPRGIFKTVQITKD